MQICVMGHAIHGLAIHMRAHSITTSLHGKRAHAWWHEWWATWVRSHGNMFNATCQHVAHLTRYIQLPQPLHMHVS